jgi:S-adenosyl-L-methionine hydrolase (adenosine-forming)
MHSIITLTTDFGTRDGFAAQMKGVILSINPVAKLIDVTHDIEPFAVVEGALVLKGVSSRFPRGTVHVAVVDPGVGSSRRGIVASAAGRMYVGPDNGIFSLVETFGEALVVREIQNSEYILKEPHSTFHGRDVFAPAAAHLSAGRPVEAVGPVIPDPVVLAIPAARPTADGIQGEVTYIDRFGNLFSNIESGMIVRSVAAVRVGDVTISGISRYFGQVDPGKPVVLINSFGLLEIAINRGDASKVLAMGKGASVKVVWA